MRSMDKRLLRAYLLRKAQEQQEIIDKVPVLGKRYGAAVDELEEIEQLLKKVKRVKHGLDHRCDWRTAAIKLARCVVATLQADGKIGMGSGMVMRVKNGKKTIERWDKDFYEALAFIGIKVVDKPPKMSKTSKRARTRAVTDAAEVTA